MGDLVGGNPVDQAVAFSHEQYILFELRRSCRLGAIQGPVGSLQWSSSADPFAALEDRHGRP
jgi:hypothetical protein